MATKTTNLIIRVNPEVKKQAEEVLGECGMTLGQAINVFLNQITICGGIPFPIRTQKARYQSMEQVRDNFLVAEALGEYNMRRQEAIREFVAAPELTAELAKGLADVEKGRVVEHEEAMPKLRSRIKRNGV